MLQIRAYSHEYSRQATDSQTNDPSPSTSTHEVENRSPLINRSSMNRGKRKLKGDTRIGRTERTIKRKVLCYLEMKKC